MYNLVADFAWARPDLDALKAVGYGGIMRYIDRNPASDAKHITQGEYFDLRARGFDVGLVFETTADRAMAGYSAGLFDAQYANSVADGLSFDGQVHGGAIYFAVDTDSYGPEVEAYFQGVNSVGGRTVGVYGPIDACNYIRDAGLAVYSWPASAWMHGKPIPANAHLFQRLGHPSGGPAGDYDENARLQDDWGQAPRPHPPTPTHKGRRKMFLFWFGDGLYFSDGIYRSPYGLDPRVANAFTQQGVPTVGAPGSKDLQGTYDSLKSLV